MSDTKLRMLKVVMFKNPNFATLQQSVNDYCKGKAVTLADSGVVAYPADDVGEKTLVDIAIDAAGVVMLFYA